MIPQVGHQMILKQWHIAQAHADVTMVWSGNVEVHELVQSLRSLGIWLNSNQLAALLGAIDPDDSGAISVEELRQFWVELECILVCTASSN